MTLDSRINNLRLMLGNLSLVFLIIMIVQELMDYRLVTNSLSIVILISTTTLFLLLDIDKNPKRYNDEITKSFKNLSFIFLFISLLSAYSIMLNINGGIGYFFSNNIAYFLLVLFSSTSIFIRLNPEKVKEFFDLKKVSNLSINNWLLPLFIFVMTQIIRLYTVGVGTDEGNFLFSTKIILQGARPYIDFWIREPLSLVFLKPYFSIIPISIIYLRYFVLIINLIILFFAHKTISVFSKNKKLNWYATSFLGVLLTFNGPLDFYQGIFYQFSYLFFIIVLFLLLKYNSDKDLSNLLKISFISFVLGVGVLFYKGLIAFLPIFIYLLYTNDAKLRNYIVMIITYISPTLLFWAYYSTKVNYILLYQLILKDIFLYSTSIFIIAILGIYILKLFKFGKLNENKLYNMSLFAIVIGATYHIIDSGNVFFKTLYGGIILQFPIVLTSIYLLNMYSANSSLIKKYLISLFLIIMVFLGFNSRGFLRDPSFELQIISSASILIFLIVNKYKENNDIKTLRYVTILNLLFLISFFSGYLMPTRFQLILNLFPLLIIFPLYLYRKNPVVITLFVGVIMLTAYSNIVPDNDYTLYTLEEFHSSVNLINNLPGDSIFSTDTAILSESNKISMIIFYSPSEFRDQNTPYEVSESYNASNLNISKNVVISKLINTPPDVIAGSGRMTYQFFNSEEKFNRLLKSQYDKKSEGRIIVYLRS